MSDLTYKLEVFEGPMDLLLHLISKHKLNINDILIVELVNQYLDYVKRMEEEDFDIAGDFLEMAARLIYIKTVSLLPKHEEAEKLKRELTGELIEYRDCKLMAEKLSHQTEGFGRYVRAPQGGMVNYDYERFHEGEELLNAYLNVAGKAMRRLPPPVETFKAIVAKRFVNVASKVRMVMRRLWSGKKVAFHTLFEGAQSKSDLVATCVAVLELAKTKRITIEGDMHDPTVQMVNEADGAVVDGEEVTADA